MRTSPFLKMLSVSEYILNVLKFSLVLSVQQFVVKRLDHKWKILYFCSFEKCIDIAQIYFFVIDKKFYKSFDYWFNYIFECFYPKIFRFTEITFKPLSISMEQRRYSCCSIQKNATFCSSLNQQVTFLKNKQLKNIRNNKDIFN